MRRKRASRKLRGLRALSVIGVVLLIASCRSDPRRQTAAEWVKDNTKIISQLASYREEEWRQGVHRFQALGKTQGSEVVVYFLEDPVVADDERTVVSLAWILSGWRDPRAIAYLVEGLHTSADVGLKQLAADGLSNYGPKRSVLDALEEASGSSDIDVRRIAITVVSESQSDRSLGILGARLKAEADADIRANCLVGIMESPPSRERRDLLILGLTDPDEAIRELAWAALIKEPDVPRVFNPRADLAARSQGVSELRLWARSQRD